MAIWLRPIKKYDARTQFVVHLISPASTDEKTVRRNEACLQSLEAAQFRHVRRVNGAYLPSDPSVGCSLSHTIAIQQAMKSSSPFILLENDAIIDHQKSPDFNLAVPNDADAVYLGISNAGLALNASKPIHHWGGNFYSPAKAPNLVRIYNMLTTHAVLICSDRFARNWQLCALEAALRQVPVDTMIARTLQHFNVYAQKVPWFYQADSLGGQEKNTRIEMRGTCIKSADELPVSLPSFVPPCISADLATI
jgi:hypothetical protein